MNPFCQQPTNSGTVNRPEPTQPPTINGVDPHLIAAANRGKPRGPDEDILPSRGKFRQLNPRGIAASFSYDAVQVGAGEDQFTFSYNHASSRFEVTVKIETVEIGKHEMPAHLHSPGRAIHQ